MSVEIAEVRCTWYGEALQRDDVVTVGEQRFKVIDCEQESNSRGELILTLRLLPDYEWERVTPDWVKEQLH